MKDLSSKIALQLYTVRDALKTPEDVKQTLQKVRAIGYEVVELAGIQGIDDATLKQMFDHAGLTCASIHVKLAQVTDELEQTMQRLHVLGCQHAAVSWSDPEYRNAEGVKKLAHILDTAGKAFKAHDLILSYHNHKFEFEKIGGKLMLEHIFDLTDPEHLNAQLDLCWVQLGGASPSAWIRKMQGRMWSVHFKDATIKNDAPVLAEIGEGNLDWPSILDACTAANVPLYIVEQDTCERDSVESARISYKNLKHMGVK